MLWSTGALLAGARRSEPCRPGPAMVYHGALSRPSRLAFLTPWHRENGLSPPASVGIAAVFRVIGAWGGSLDKWSMGTDGCGERCVGPVVSLAESLPTIPVARSGWLDTGLALVSLRGIAPHPTPCLDQCPWVPLPPLGWPPCWRRFLGCDPALHGQ